MRCARGTVGWMLLALSWAASLNAAEPPVAKLIGGDGLLAVLAAEPGRSDSSGPWRIVRIGDALPPICQLRAAGGACRLQTPSGDVCIGSDARVRLDLARRLLAVEAGSVSLKSKANEAWACESEGLRAEIQPASAAEITVEPRRHVAIGVLEGSVEVQPPGQPKPVRVGAKTRWTWQSADKRVASAPLSPQDEKRLTAWAARTKDSPGRGSTDGQRRAVGLARAAQRRPVSRPRRPAPAGGAGADRPVVLQPLRPAGGRDVRVQPAAGGLGEPLRHVRRAASS